jgi:hypothetical protein
MNTIEFRIFISIILIIFLNGCFINQQLKITRYKEYDSECEHIFSIDFDFKNLSNDTVFLLNEKHFSFYKQWQECFRGDSNCLFPDYYYKIIVNGIKEGRYDIGDDAYTKFGIIDTNFCIKNYRIGALFPKYNKFTLEESLISEAIVCPPKSITPILALYGAWRFANWHNNTNKKDLTVAYFTKGKMHKKKLFLN